MLQLRIPGGLVNAKYLSNIQEIAEKFGNGTFKNIPSDRPIKDI